MQLVRVQKYKKITRNSYNNLLDLKQSVNRMLLIKRQCEH